MSDNQKWALLLAGFLAAVCALMALVGLIGTHIAGGKW